jgi:hypothetical protein
MQISTQLAQPALKLRPIDRKMSSAIALACQQPDSSTPANVLAVHTAAARTCSFPIRQRTVRWATGHGCTSSKAARLRHLPAHYLALLIKMARRLRLATQYRVQRSDSLGTHATHLRFCNFNSSPFHVCRTCTCRTYGASLARAWSLVGVTALPPGEGSHLPVGVG